MLFIRKVRSKRKQTWKIDLGKLKSKKSLLSRTTEKEKVLEKFIN